MRYHHDENTSSSMRDSLQPSNEFDENEHEGGCLENPNSE